MSNTDHTDLHRLASQFAFKMAESVRVRTAASRLRKLRGEKVGRNDLCPCGSGKKSKRCCR